MNAEIIAVGTELLLGQIVNSNGQYISQKLAEIGINVFYHSVVGDNEKRMRDTMEIAQKRSNLIIITGGLGPTQDDITKETLAELLDKSLVINEEVLHTIEAYFIKRKMSMTSNNRKQAMVIEGSRIFPNDNGLAAGMAVPFENGQFILLPGPPSELNLMFSKYVLPFLQLIHSDNYIISKTLRFFGVGESRLDNQLADFINEQSNPTIAPLASNYEVSLRLTAKANTRDQAEQMILDVEQKIKSQVGRYIYGENGDSLEKIVVSLLKERGESVATAESCTGGMISQMLTSIPGSSGVFFGSVVSYTNQVKQSVLQLPEHILKNNGAVSEQTAGYMAESIRKLMGTTYGLSVTGVAGPDKQEDKDVGTVFIGLSTGFQTRVFPLNLAGLRDGIRLQAAKYSLFYLWQTMKER